MRRWLDASELQEENFMAVEKTPYTPLSHPLPHVRDRGARETQIGRYVPRRSRR
jgi:hypothetical protein